ncbi:MAG: prealbumin-like fold domain-containing protein, partial [Chloroflexota bacterium]
PEGNLVILKVDNKGTADQSDDTLLDGATFSVYLDDGDKEFSASSDELVRGPDTATGGELDYTGLAEGDYWVVEVVVPDGFTGSDPILVTIEFDSGLCAYDSTGFLGCFEGDQEFPTNATLAIVDNTPGGGVEGNTGTPHVTLPPTDALAGPTAPASENWRLMLVVMAALLASILVLTPSRRTNRRS